MTTRGYPCSVRRVIDGDTIEVLVDHGFRISSVQSVRIFGINAPELSTAAGQVSAQWARTWVGTPFGDWPFTLVAQSESDKYGRRLGDVVKPSGESYAASILAAGHAVVWDGKGPKPV